MVFPINFLYLFNEYEIDVGNVGTPVIVASYPSSMNS